MRTYQLTDTVQLILSHPLHAASLHKAVRKNRAHLAPYLAWVGQMKAVEDFEKYLTNCANEQDDGKEWSFNIFREKNIIGRIGLHHIDQNNRNACIGYWLDKKEEGKGLITHATKVIIQYAFEELRLHRIEILTATHNVKSAAIPIKLGFQKEGVLRETEKHGTQFYDLNIFSLLRSEWQK